MNTDKIWIRDLVEIAVKKGIRKVVISPGSRSAPLVIAFARHPEIECLSIIDERVAAFFALGMAQQLKQPVGLVCTSGSAVLNYAPAIAEAYYQNIPIVVFSADRPTELIDQGDSQTIRQRNILANYVKKSFELPVSVTTNDDRWFSNRIISEAINCAQQFDPGPVHVNIPLREPLYNIQDDLTYQPPKIIEEVNTEAVLHSADLNGLKTLWQNCPNKMVLVGLNTPDNELDEILNKHAEDPSLTILTETTSNINCSNTIKCIDPTLENLSGEEKRSFCPDLLVTFGGEIVSKKIKAYFRKYKPAAHWHLSMSNHHNDTFQSLTKIIGMKPTQFFTAMLSNEFTASDYQSLWLGAYERAKSIRESFLDDIPYCDLSVFKNLIETIPPNSNLHFANSTPVRYSNIFEINGNRQISVNSNRGTSGIDGSISTAAGAAYVNNRLTTIITGDLGFFYDSNALWNQHLSPHLRIIIINNGGGNIFRIIPGPSDLPELEKYFETKQDISAEHIARAFEIPFYFCEDFDLLTDHLEVFFEPHEKAAILEIKTPAEISAEILREYLFKIQAVHNE